MYFQVQSFKSDVLLNVYAVVYVVYVLIIITYQQRPKYLIQHVILICYKCLLCNATACYVLRVVCRVSSPSQLCCPSHDADHDTPLSVCSLCLIACRRVSLCIYCRHRRHHARDGAVAAAWRCVMDRQARHVLPPHDRSHPGE